MKRLFRLFFVLLIGHLALVIGHSRSAQAQNLLRYPVPELGYCRDAKECSLYCQIPQNKAACWSYAKFKLGPQVLGTTTMGEDEKRLMREKAKQYNVTFPIGDLGNCAGPQECRDFCEQPTNHETCMSFAKKKGFAKEMERSGEDDGIPPEKKQEIMLRARTELGCSSMESCRAICENDQTTCEAFAKKHGLHKKPPQEHQQKVELLKKAREDLGCTSFESCRTVCESNPERCMTFAKKHGFDKGNEPRGGEYRQAEEQSGRGSSIRPPCASEESCKKYCQEHPSECPGFQGKPSIAPAGDEFRPPAGGSSGVQSAGFVGPTGCKTEAECKSFCQSNPDKCPGFQDARDILHAYPSYAPTQTRTGGYKGSTQYQYPGTSGGYQKPTGTQYNVSPSPHPSYTPSTNSGYSGPTPSTYSPQPTP